MRHIVVAPQMDGFALQHNLTDGTVVGSHEGERPGAGSVGQNVADNGAVQDGEDQFITMACVNPLLKR